MSRVGIAMDPEPRVKCLFAGGSPSETQLSFEVAAVQGGPLPEAIAVMPIAEGIRYLDV